jgi:hypothetical protein
MGRPTGRIWCTGWPPAPRDLGESAKLARFHAELRRRGIARPFEGRLETWTYPPLAETDRAAAELLRRYDSRRLSA